jgi:hypothetical protein
MNHEKDLENQETQPLCNFWQYCHGSPGLVYDDDVILGDLAEQVEERQNSSEESLVCRSLAISGSGEQFADRPSLGDVAAVAAR